MARDSELDETRHLEGNFTVGQSFEHAGHGHSEDPELQGDRSPCGRLSPAESDIGAEESGQIVQDVVETTASCRIPGSFGAA